MGKFVGKGKKKKTSPMNWAVNIDSAPFRIVTLFKLYID